jgi:hypothetical protein
LGANVEHGATHGAIALMEPASEATPQMLEIQSILGEETIQENQGVGAVIAPRPGGDAVVRASKAVWRIELEAFGIRYLRRRVKLIRHPQRVANQEAQEATGETVRPCELRGSDGHRLLAVHDATSKAQQKLAKPPRDRRF